MGRFVVAEEWPVSRIRARVKDHLPGVLLTLLSIVQALALELLWSHLQEARYLYEATWQAAIWWLQVFANFLGIVVIWVIYASSAMRFRWVPTVSDSVFPFVVGVGEFLLVATLGPAYLGVWFLAMAGIFALMNWISHISLRRARQDPENEEFFSRVAPATLRDFFPAMASVLSLAAFGGYFLFAPGSLPVVVAGMLLVTALLLLQLYAAGVFWERTFNPDPIDPRA